MCLDEIDTFFPMLHNQQSCAANHHSSVTPTLETSRPENSQLNEPLQTNTLTVRSCITNTRHSQRVLSNAQRYKIVMFMIDDAASNGVKGLCARTIRCFSSLFKGKSNAMFAHAMRYWKDRERIITTYKQEGRRGNGNYYVKPTAMGVKVFVRKTAARRGRKKITWCAALHKDLLKEFERLRCAGVKFNRHILKLLALRLIHKSEMQEYNLQVRDPHKGDLIVDHISIRWVQTFMQENNIVCRSQTGKLQLSKAKQELIERQVAYHLGQLRRDFNEGNLDENSVFNADETHFFFNMHNNKTLAIRGDQNVKYADVISGDEGMTMMVTIRGGSMASLSPAFMVFQNDNRSYPIRNVPDNVPGACYRSSPKSWIDSTVFKEWFRERRALGKLSNGKKRVMYMDNCSSHVMDDEVQDLLREINTEIRFLPANATDLCQPADSFIIQKLKTEWRRQWDMKRIEMIENNMWGSAHKGSGKLANPGKTYFLKLAADVVRELNKKRDKDNVLYSRKAMIKCGLSKNCSGVWEEGQLFSHLQHIIEKYRMHFDDQKVGMDQDLDGERTESDTE